MIIAQLQGGVVMGKKKWTAEKDQKLRTLLASGVSVNRMSVVLDRSRMSIRGAARRLGLDLPKPKRLPREDRQ